MTSPAPDPWPSAEPAVAVPTDDMSEASVMCGEGDWDDTPSLVTDVVPALLPVGCNAYWRDVQYVWLRFDSVEDGPERDDVRWVGRRLDWYDWFIDETGWAGVLDADTHVTECGWLDWMLREGVAPGQSFCVRVYACHYQSYEGEWDLDVDWEVVARESWDEARVLAAWEAEMGGRADD